MTVRKLLESKGNFVPFVRPDSTVADVTEILQADEVGALVVTNDQRNILGIVTERDIVNALNEFGPNVMETSVSDVMTEDVITCEFGQPISSILELMHEHQIHHIPITEQGELCGIINMLDLVKYRLDELEEESMLLKNYVAGNV